MDNDCTFCSIVNSETEAGVLYENDKVVVLCDINPQAPVHLLVIPKKHIRSVNDLSVEDEYVIATMIMVAKKMAKQKKIDKSGYKIFFNVEKGGGQVVFHLHLHLVGGWK